MPVDQVTTPNVLKPIWTAKSVTAGRLRGRTEVIIDAARVLGHIDADRANCAATAQASQAHARPSCGDALRGIAGVRAAAASGPS